MTPPGSVPARVFCVTRIGDLVLATVTFDALAARHGSIHLVTSTLADGLVEGDPRVERVDILRHPDGLRGRTAIMRQLVDARRGGATVVNLEVAPPRWKLIHRMASLMGLEAHHLDLDAYRAAEHAGTPRHAAAFYGDVVGLDPAPPAKLHVGARADAEARRILGEGHDPVVVVHPGSHGKWTAKRVSPELLAEVVRHVGAEMDGRVLFVGGPHEAELCAGVLASSGIGARGTNLAGSLSLGALSAVLRRAGVFLGETPGP